MAETLSKKNRLWTLNHFLQILRNIANKHWWVQALVVGLILFVGITVRAVQVDRYPINNLDDGIYYVWAGVTFWQNPLQVSSLTLFDTDNSRLFWRSQYLDELPSEEFGFRLIQPWFDHPPLGAAIIGLPAYLLGYTAFENIPFSIVRLPAVLASVFTLLFSFLLFKRLFGFRQSLIATCILAITPYFVFAHRQSYLENVLTPFFLLAIWQGYQVINAKQGSKWNWILTVTACFVCGWIKLVGLAVPLILAAWSLRKKDWKAVTIFVLTAVVSLGSYIAYGLAADASGFWQTLTSQGGRGMQWGNSAEIIVNQGLAGVFKDSSLLLGWIAVFLFMFVTSQAGFQRNKETDAEEFFTWVFISWLLVVVVTSGQLNSFIWYRYPLFPFLSLGISWFVLQLWQRPNLLGSLLLTLLGWSQLFVIFPTLIENGGSRLVVLLAIVIPLALFILPKVTRVQTSWIHRFWLLTICLLITVTNLLVVLKFPDYNCAHANHCVLPKKIIINE